MHSFFRELYTKSESKKYINQQLQLLTENQLVRETLWYGFYLILQCNTTVASLYVFEIYNLQLGSL